MPSRPRSPSVVVSSGEVEDRVVAEAAGAVVVDVEGPHRARLARPRRGCRCPAGPRARWGCRPRPPGWRSPGRPRANRSAARSVAPPAGARRRLRPWWSSCRALGDRRGSPLSSAAGRRAGEDERDRDASVPTVERLTWRMGLIRPSCTTDTARRPSAVQMSPRARPRPPEVDGESWSYSSHSSARNGRWNHMAWSRLAICTRSSSECAAVGQHRGVEQGHVRRVGEHAGVQHRVVGQLAVGPDPHPLAGRQRLEAVRR